MPGERSNDAISGKDADPDDDNRSNLLEYLGGTLPKSPDRNSFLTAEVVQLGDPKYPAATYTLQRNQPDVEGILEYSNDMVTWNHNDDGTGKTYFRMFNRTNNGDTETVTYRANDAMAPGKTSFIRLRAVSK